MSKPIIWLAVLALVAALGGAATAGPAKPTAAQAKKAIVAWRAEIKKSNLENNGSALTANPFVTADHSEDAETSEPTCQAVGTDRKSTAEALRCVATNLDGLDDTSNLKTWSKKLAKQRGIATLEKKRLAELAKKATLVKLDNGCAGEGDEAVLAVIKDTDGTLKVAAAFRFHYYCGE